MAELAKLGYKVTVLTRDGASDKVKFPAGVEKKAVDYASVESLKAALAGQDAVVSTFGTMAIGDQRPLIDAALAVGVKRFIPSEFGCNTRKASGVLGAVLTAKVKTVDYLDELAKANSGFTWTGLSIGWFFDFCLSVGWLGYNLKDKTAVVYDSGNEPSQSTNLYFAGRAIAGVFTHLDETANKYLEISSFNPTQNEIMRILEEETGEKWTVTHVNTKDLQKIGEEKIGRFDYDGGVLDLLNVWQYQDGAGNAPIKTSAVGLLGLKNEDVRTTIKAWLASEQELSEKAAAVASEPPVVQAVTA